MRRRKSSERSRRAGPLDDPPPGAPEAPGLDEEAQRSALLFMLEDLEEDRRKIEQARREWTKAFDAIRDPVFIHDANYRIVRANRAYAERAGGDFAAILGRPYWEVFPQRSGPLTHCQVATEDKQDSVTEEFTLDTGEIFVSRAFVIRDNARRFLYAIHVLEDITERRRAETERRMLSEALRQSAAGLILLNSDLSFRYANPAACELVGYKPGQLDGLPMATVVPENMHERTPAIQAAVDATGHWTGEVILAARDGTLIPTYLSASTIMDANGKSLAYVGSWLDLRPIKQAQEALAASEARFRLLTENASDLVAVVDPDGKLLYISQSVQRQLGYTPDEIAGHNMADFLHPEDIAAAQAKIARSIAEPSAAQVMTHRLRRKDGSWRYFETLGRNLLHEPAVGGIVLNSRDITKRKQAEAGLRLFRTLLDNSNDAIEVIDPDSLRFLDVNEKECRDLGYTREELLSMTVLDIDPSFGPASMKMIDEQVRKSGFALFERTHRRKDGSIFSVEIGLKFAEIEGKTYVLSIARDITERKKAEQALSRANRALKTLSAGNEALVRATDEQALLDEMCRVIVEIGGYRIAWVGYAEQDAARTIRIVARRGIGVVVPESLSLSWGDSGLGRQPAGEAIRRRVPQIVQDISKEPSLFPWHDAMRESGLASLIALPLLTDSAAFGVLNILAGEADAFSDDEAKLLQELATDVGFGIMMLRTRAEHQQLQEGHLKIAKRLKETLSDAIRAIALTVEKRDPYTAGHQNRVTDLCAAIGQELALPDDRIEGMRLAALIHDIGKIYVPAEILNRPGKLSNAEFEIIKSHPEVGYDIVKDVKFPWPVAETIRQHHERLDGTGYPRGLKGEDIILEARILMVADTVEAMSSHRPYRPAHGIEAALAEIERHRGEWYDPAAVDACLRLFREKGFQMGAPGAQGP